MYSFEHDFFKNTSIGTARITYSDGIIKDCNQSFAMQMCHTNNMEIIGKKLSNNFVSSDLSLREDFLELFKGDILENHEIRIELPNSKFLYILIFACINRNEDYIDLMTVDVTKQKESKEANREKSDFLALVNHEIRTPLATIIGFSELLAAKITDDKFKRYIQEIDKSSKNLLLLINDMLDLSKLEMGTLKIKNEKIRGDKI